MTETLLDVVTVQDRETGERVTKNEAHAKKLIHRCAAVYVFDGSGKLLVQEHKVSGGKLDHTVGGHVDTGETYEQAAYREMEEEIGLTGVKLKPIATSVYSDEEVCNHMFGIFECTAPKNWKFVPNEEVEKIKPMNIKEITALMKNKPKLFTGGFINTMAKFIEVKELPIKFDLIKIRKN